MNQIREWEGVCQSCFSTTVEYTMSAYDVTLVCLKCAENERKYIKSQIKNESNEKNLPPE